MRRPPPPPRPPAGSAERRGDRVESTPARGRSALDPVESAAVADDGSNDGGTGAADAGEQANSSDAVEREELVSTRDVWRAARARRRALRAEIRRFTQRSRRRRVVWLSAIGVAVVVIGGSVAVAYSPLFAVEKITVVGAATLDQAAVEAALAGQLGTPLALVDASEVKAALLSFPLIETYALEAQPPHDLTVRIVERTPVGVFRSEAGYTLVDAAGVALATTSDQPAAQPLLEIEGGAESAAFESAGLVVRSLPADVRAALTDVTATTADDVTLTLNTGLTVVWGSSDRSVQKAVVLSQALAANPGASSIDVTSPEIAVVG